jgi:hypothetical protein
MRYSYLVPLTFCALLVSCTSTRPLLAPGTVAEINSRARAQGADIFLQEPGAPARGPIEAADLRIGVDSVSWIDPSTLALRTAPARSLYKVTFSDHVRGVFDGAGVGLAGGAVLGGMLGVLLIHSSGSAGQASGGLKIAIHAAAILGAVGAVAGAVGGGISGSEIAYVRTERFESPLARERQKSSRGSGKQ